MSKYLGILVLSLLLSPAHSATQFITGKITKVWIADGYYGNCLVQIDNFASPAVNCPANWFSFSCTGDFNKKEISSRMLEMAQMSLVLSRTIGVAVDDTKKHNGYCTATEVELR